jgi:hypothetical protein
MSELKRKRVENWTEEQVERNHISKFRIVGESFRDLTIGTSPLAASG